MKTNPFRAKAQAVRDLIAAEQGDGLDLEGALAAHRAAHELEHMLQAAGISGELVERAQRMLEATIRLIEKAGGEHHGPTPPPGDGHRGPTPPAGGVRMDPLRAAADVPHGTSGDDDWTGTAAAEDRTGGEGEGDDVLRGDAGADRLWGNMGNDMLYGGAGDDLLVGGFGADMLTGGAGNDVLLSRSDAGEPDITPQESREADRVARLTDSLGFRIDFAKQPHDDVLTGGQGADTFHFEIMTGTKPPQMLERLRPDGDIDWSWIAMNKNGSLHYHWVDSIGDDTIADFNRAEGDRIKLLGHTIAVREIAYDGTNSVIHLISRSTNPDARKLAHEGDDLGSITVLNARVTMDDITIDTMPVFGNLVRPDDTADLRRDPFLYDDSGVLPGLGLPGEDPWMMVM